MNHHHMCECDDCLNPSKSRKLGPEYGRTYQVGEVAPQLAELMALRGQDLVKPKRRRKEAA